MATPFRTARAQARAPEILDFAATLGAAVLLDPTGTPVLTSGAEAAVRQLLEEDPRHEATFAGGWTLLVRPAPEAPVEAVRRRLRAAVRLFTLALADREPPAGQGSAAPARVTALRTRIRVGRRG